jgi:hypothetical protein
MSAASLALYMHGRVGVRPVYRGNWLVALQIVNCSLTPRACLVQIGDQEVISLGILQPGYDDGTPWHVVHTSENVRVYGLDYPQEVRVWLDADCFEGEFTSTSFWKGFRTPEMLAAWAAKAEMEEKKLESEPVTAAA